MSESKGRESVKVVVRCRPLNKTETADGRKAIVDVDMSRMEIRLPNPENPKEPVKTFPFDHVFAPNTTQEYVFDHCARDIVQACIDGFNGTIFAYGQTGTGKTFSMTGVLENPELRGITPRSFAKIFQFIAATQQNTEFLVRASYLEIYNEQIRDLLSDDPKKKLDLKQHPTMGVFVKDLTAFAVKTEQEMDAVMNRGAANRAVAATKMNEGSSRSHAIFTVVVEANQRDEQGRDHIRVGKLNLVDLAGSERAGKTEATGERLKEGCAINLSLVALGNVISALVDGKAKHIPYRDSKLTRLLEDSLGGSAKTAMVANIGPADFNYEETLSTLRYASRAKNIKNKPKINEDPKDALLRELREEIAQLKKELGEIGGEGAVALQQVRDLGQAAGIDPAVLEQLRQETDEKIQVILAERGVLEESRGQIAAALANLRETEAEEREMRETVESRIRLLETNICVGGVNLFEENAAMQAQMRQHEEELRRNEEEARKLQQQLVATREEDFAAEETHATLQEDIAARIAKLRRMQERTALYVSEADSFRREWEKEKLDLLQTVRELAKEMARLQAVVDSFVPDQVQQMLVDMCRHDPDTDEWTIRGLHLAGGRAARHRRSVGFARRKGGVDEEEEERKAAVEPKTPRVEPAFVSQRTSGVTLFLSFSSTAAAASAAPKPKPATVAMARGARRVIAVAADTTT